MQQSLNLNITDETPKILNLDKISVMLDYLPQNCIIADIETTGLNPVYDSIIEISALKICGMEIKDKFSILINPHKKISKFITNLTGINDEMLKNASETEKSLIDFCNFIELNPIVGHNIKFDLSFLNTNLRRFFKKSLPNDYADTLFFSRKVYRELKSHKLTNIAKYLNIDTKGAHRALNDCYMTYYIMKDIINKSAC